jgi:hypothetical protein
MCWWFDGLPGLFEWNELAVNIVTPFLDGPFADFAFVERRWKSIFLGGVKFKS